MKKVINIIKKYHGYIALCFLNVFLSIACYISFDLFNEIYSLVLDDEIYLNTIKLALLITSYPYIVCLFLSLIIIVPIAQLLGKVKGSSKRIFFISYLYVEVILFFLVIYLVSYPLIIIVLAPLTI